MPSGPAAPPESWTATPVLETLPSAMIARPIIGSRSAPVISATALTCPVFSAIRAITDGSTIVPVAGLSGLVGQTWYYQAIFRDVANADHTGTGLSNGVKVTYAP